MYVLTHRGLDPSIENYYPESTWEAFIDQLNRGFGLEFDLQLSSDGNIFVFHDDNLARITNGVDARRFSELTSHEIEKIRINNCRLISLTELLKLIEHNGSKNIIHAIHVKSSFQTQDRLDRLISCLEYTDKKSFILFDVPINIATYIKRKNQTIQLAPSVSHSYDILRYNIATGGTLLSLDEALKYSSLFSWIWLDEWDRTDQNNTCKKLYTAETFNKIRKKKLRIALVTPELHKSSPGLLGNESHQDAQTIELLEYRMKEIVNLKPDLVCTDYPDFFKKLC